MTGFLNLTVSGVSIWAKLPYDFYIVHVVILFCFCFCCVSTLYTLVLSHTKRLYQHMCFPFVVQDYNASSQMSYLSYTSSLSVVVKRTCQNMEAARGQFPANTSKFGGNWNPHTTFNPGYMVFHACLLDHKTHKKDEYSDRFLVTETLVFENISWNVLEIHNTKLCLFYYPLHNFLL